jgi:hypothetical protein
MVLRQKKLYGRVLDASGRWVRATPVDPWALEHGAAPRKAANDRCLGAGRSQGR